MNAFLLPDPAEIFAGFAQSYCGLGCGRKYGPTHQRSVPYSCFTKHAVPASCDWEWEYLRTHTELWQRCQPVFDPYVTMRELSFPDEGE